ncbi:MAG: hypothetical protein V1684_00645, partial [bacterium]
MKTKKQKTKFIIIKALFYTGLLALGGVFATFGFFDPVRNVISNGVDALAVKIDKTEIKPIVSVNLPNSSPADNEGQDYWLWIRTWDKYGFDQETTVGKSKRGDVVAIAPVTAQYEPTAPEKNIYAIIKVSGLTPEEREKYTLAWQVEDGYLDGAANEKRYKTLAYRQYKIDLDALGIKVGLDPNPKSAVALRRFAYLKDQSDLARYEKGRKLYVLKNYPRYLALKLKNYLVPPSVAVTEEISCVNCAPGTDCPAANCNSTEDYNTLTLWEADTDNDLTASTVIATAECY